MPIDILYLLLFFKPSDSWCIYCMDLISNIYDSNLNSIYTFSVQYSYTLFVYKTLHYDYCHKSTSQMTLYYAVSLNEIFSGINLAWTLRWCAESQCKSYNL